MVNRPSYDFDSPHNVFFTFFFIPRILASRHIQMMFMSYATQLCRVS